MDRAPAVSVIIPTYNRRERLGRVLGALDRQSTGADRFEVVVVDDGSSDGTAAWLRSQRRRYELRVEEQENRGPAHARNTGVAAARNPLLLFLDDDVEPSPELVAEHLRSHGTVTDRVVIGPLGSLPQYDEPWVAWEQAKLEAQYAAMTRGDWAPTFRQFWTGNASVHREHVLAVGGFNPSFLRAEDVELGLRLHRRGLEFAFNPHARSLHHASRSLESWIKAHLSYGRLEVQIFGSDGEDALVSCLAGNWSRLHPSTRWLVRQSLESPAKHAALRGLLERALRLGAARHTPRVSEKICSLLANLLYWQASVDALGPSLARRVFDPSSRRSAA